MQKLNTEEPRIYSHLAECCGYNAMVDFTTKGIINIYTNFDSKHIVATVLAVNNSVVLPQNHDNSKYLFTCSSTSDENHMMTALNIHTKLCNLLFEFTLPENDENSPKIEAGVTILTHGGVLRNVTDVVIYEPCRHLYVYSDDTDGGINIFHLQDSTDVYHAENKIKSDLKRVIQNGNEYYIGIFDARRITKISPPQGTTLQKCSQP